MSEAMRPTWPAPVNALTIKWDAQLQEWLVLDRGEEFQHFSTLLEAETFVIAESERREAGA